MHTLEFHTPDSAPPAEAGEARQYSLAGILGIWVAATAPMGLLAWVVWPAVRDLLPWHPGLTFWMLMTAGMIWLFALSLMILRHELGTLRWSVLAERIRAAQPHSPRTGHRRPALWWRLIPIAAVFAALTWASMERLDPLLGGLGLVAPAGTQTSELMDPQFVGQWWIVGLAIISFAFNYALGEELLFRGVLPPRMAGVFGGGDWVANAVLFAMYHVHKFWMLPTVLLTSLPFSWAARHYRTIWFAVVLHSIEGVVLLALVIAVVSGAIEL